MENVRVIELFAGVGGFRIGLERADAEFFKTIWANQWEPATKVQHAAMVYEKNFGAGSVVNEDINNVLTKLGIISLCLFQSNLCNKYNLSTTLSI